MFESTDNAELPSPGACGTEELVGLMAAHARAEAMSAQRKLAAVAELDRRRRSGEERLGYACSETGEFVVAEVGVALTLSKGMASCFVDIGTSLDTRLPATKQAFARGELDFARVRVIVERTAHLSDALLALIEPQVLDKALAPGRELIRARLGAAIDRLVLTADPDGARQRRLRAERDRDVQVRPDADGMCSLWGAMPGVDGRVLDERLRGMAMGVCGSDPRTLGQRRSDALTALALGADHLACTCTDPSCPCRPERSASPRVLIQVMVDAATLAGAADLPGVLSGFGVVDPALVRRLAADAAWQQVLTDAPGTVIGVGPVRAGGTVPEAGASAWHYRPNAKLARLVRARDGQCRFPGCGVPARNCDLDHITPFDHDNPSAGGPTTADNLHCLCRWHHRLKTRGDWTVRFQPGAVMAWTSPTGTAHETLAHGGNEVSYVDQNARVPKPPPDEYHDPPGWSDKLPDPWNDAELQKLIESDPMSPAQLRTLQDRDRFDHPPPDPEEPDIIQVVHCTCPAPF